MCCRMCSVVACLPYCWIWCKVQIIAVVHLTHLPPAAVQLVSWSLAAVQVVLSLAAVQVVLVCGTKVFSGTQGFSQGSTVIING